MLKNTRSRQVEAARSSHGQQGDMIRGLSLNARSMATAVVLVSGRHRFVLLIELVEEKSYRILVSSINDFL